MYDVKVNTIIPCFVLVMRGGTLSGLDLVDKVDTENRLHSGRVYDQKGVENHLHGGRVDVRKHFETSPPGFKMDTAESRKDKRYAF